MIWLGATLSKDQQEYVETYYENNGKRLRDIVNSQLKRYGGIYQEDLDDFYSLANEVFCHAIKEFNGTGTFECFFKFKLSNKIKTEITKRNRQKRGLVEIVEEDGKKIKVYHRPVSLNEPISSDSDSTYADILCSDFDIDAHISDEIDILYDDRISQYLEMLTPTQKKIAIGLMHGYNHQDISKELCISEKKYRMIVSDMKQFEKTRILRAINNSGKEDKKMDCIATTLETSKDDKLSVSAITKKIDNCTIRFDHPLQRASEQWDSKMKGNLISDILQGNPIPEIVLAEQVVNGLAIVWDIDGKQRCTNVHSFKYDGFKINKNINRGIITYQAIAKDENGKPILDEKGYPISEKRACDIRGKKFSELPEELQDRFLEYDFKIVQYLNCNTEDIAYHIERYNSGRPMNTSQKGITRIGALYAEKVKNIAAMPFFKELGGYKVSDHKNGTIDRVIVESIMAINFLNDWIKKQEDMCAFLKENASEEMFEHLEDIVEAISKSNNDEFYSIFDSKNSFIYFTLYDRFTKICRDKTIKDFVSFLLNFEREMKSKEVDGISFEMMNEKSSKDKATVIGKMKILESLLKEYFDVDGNIDEHCQKDEEKDEEEDEIDIDVMDFVHNHVSKDITHDDVADYYSMLDAYDIDHKSKLLDWQNEPSLVAIIAYSFKNDINLDDWIISFFDRHHEYDSDQDKNYTYMLNDLKTFNLHTEQIAG